MTNAPDPAKVVAAAHVEVLGRTDYMTHDQLAVIGELPRYLRAEGLIAELHFREPGGMGPFPPVESITMFLAANAAAGVIGGAAWAALTGAVRWGRERIRREPPYEPDLDAFDPDPDAERNPTVDVMLYGPRGELLSRIAVSSDEVITLFGDQVIDPDLPR